MFFLCEYSCFACCVPGVIFFLFMYMLLDTLDCVIYHTRLSSFYGSEIDASIHLYLWWSPRLFWVFLVPRRTRDRRAISTILIHVLCMNTYNHHNNANPFMRYLEAHTLSLPKESLFRRLSELTSTLRSNLDASSYCRSNSTVLKSK